MSAPQQVLVSYNADPAGFYVDPVGGNNGNAGTSPSQAYATYAPLTAYDGVLPIFTKLGGVYVTSTVLTLTHDSHEDLTAGQSITQSSGVACGWVMGDGRVLLTDSISTSPGFNYATEAVFTIRLIIPNKTLVTVMALVGIDADSFIYIPGSGFPSVAGFTALTTFDISLNNFGAACPTPTGCAALETYLIDRTGATGTPPDVSGCTSLETYWLFENSLSGSLSSLPSSLVEFRGESCGLTGLPASINCPNTTIFRMFDNPINGPMPTSIVVAGEFNMADCGLTGTIPVGLSASTGLTSVDLNGNAFTGVTTGTWSTQPDIDTLDLSFCGLTPTQLNVILDDCVDSLGVPGRVTCNLDIRQASGSVSGQGLIDIATLQGAGWTVSFF